MPVKMTCVDHIETSAECDNECKYCPSPLQADHRRVGLMTMETFEKAMTWIDYCVAMGTQTQLNLYGVGEPLLNPNIIEMVAIARKHLGPNIPLHLNTNGNNMTDKIAEALKEAGVTGVDVTGHKPKTAARTIKSLQKYGIFGVLNQDYILHPNDWAGQVSWFKADYTYDCPWLFSGRVFIMWDGQVSRCSLDAFGQGVFADIYKDSPNDIKLTRFKLCDTCHSHTPKEE